MAVRLDNRQDGFEQGFSALLASKREATVDVADTVSSIIADVRARGDAALLELTAKFDGMKAGSMAELAVPRREIDAALEALTPALRDSLEPPLRASVPFMNGSVRKASISPMMMVSALACAIRRWMPVSMSRGQGRLSVLVLMNAIPAEVAGVLRRDRGAGAAGLCQSDGPCRRRHCRC